MKKQTRIICFFTTILLILIQTVPIIQAESVINTNKNQESNSIQYRYIGSIKCKNCEVKNRTDYKIVANNLYRIECVIPGLISSISRIKEDTTIWVNENDFLICKDCFILTKLINEENQIN